MEDKKISIKIMWGTPCSISIMQEILNQKNQNQFNFNISKKVMMKSSNALAQIDYINNKLEVIVYNFEVCNLDMRKLNRYQSIIRSRCIAMMKRDIRYHYKKKIIESI